MGASGLRSSRAQRPELPGQSSTVLAGLSVDEDARVPPLFGDSTFVPPTRSYRPSMFRGPGVRVDWMVCVRKRSASSRASTVYSRLAVWKFRTQRREPTAKNL